MNLTKTAESVSARAALSVVAAALEAGERAGVAVSAAVCDPAAGLVAYAHGDGATPHSAETSRRKAQTSASTRRATGWMPPELAVALPLASGNMLTNVGGGFPVKFGGRFVGALGVAGGTVEQDAAIARAALASVGADAE